MWPHCTAEETESRSGWMTPGRSCAENRGTDIAKRVVKHLPPGLELPYLTKAASIVACCRYPSAQNVPFASCLTRGLYQSDSMKTKHFPKL